MASTFAPFLLKGKTAIVTGAGSGINLAFSSLLLSRGCNVVFADLGLRPEAKAITDKYSGFSSGPRAIFQKTDVTDWTQLSKMFEVAEKEFGGTDLVCPGAALDEKFGIRVNACCPGIIKTPLWTDNPDKMKYVDQKKDVWATPEEVAEAMLKLVEDEDMVGGTILEVGHEQTRIVPMLNNPGPKGAAISVSGTPGLIDGVLESLSEEGWGKP
ncbi:unnamed protein product [Aureobasidium pullulans]|nr:unnamed protein product [Aureobasidium pullulans]